MSARPFPGAVGIWLLVPVCCGVFHCVFHFPNALTCNSSYLSTKLVILFPLSFFGFFSSDYCQCVCHEWTVANHRPRVASPRTIHVHCHSAPLSAWSVRRQGGTVSGDQHHCSSGHEDSNGTTPPPGGNFFLTNCLFFSFSRGPTVNCLLGFYVHSCPSWSSRLYWPICRRCLRAPDRLQCLSPTTKYVFH